MIHLKHFSLLFALIAFTGCIGFGIPNPAQSKPFTLFKGGDQLGRDQLANRWLVSQSKVLIQGKGQNEVLTFLGQPQQIQVREHKISEDWYFVYYKRYKTAPETPEGTFVVRFYQDEVIDVVRITA